MRRAKPGKRQRQRRPSRYHCPSCFDPPCPSRQALGRAFLAVFVTYCVQCNGNRNGTSTCRSAAPSARPGGSAGNSWARKDAIGRRPMCWWMPTGLPALSSMKLISGNRMSTGVPSRISKLVLPLLPTTCRAVCRCSSPNRARFLEPGAFALSGPCVNILVRREAMVEARTSVDLLTLVNVRLWRRLDDRRYLFTLSSLGCFLLGK